MDVLVAGGPQVPGAGRNPIAVAIDPEAHPVCRRGVTADIVGAGSVPVGEHSCQVAR